MPSCGEDVDAQMEKGEYERRGAGTVKWQREQEKKLRKRGGGGEKFYSIGRGINTAKQVAQKKTINYFYRMEEKQT